MLSSGFIYNHFISKLLNIKPGFNDARNRRETIIVERLSNNTLIPCLWFSIDGYNQPNLMNIYLIRNVCDADE
jgi:hypothetical protein